GLAAARHELVVGKALLASRRVDADDPQAAKRPLACLAVAIGVGQRFLELLLGPPVARVFLSPVASGLLGDLAPLLAGVARALDGRHRSAPSQESIHVADVAGRDVLLPTERPLPLGGLLLQVVALHRVAALELPRSRHLEPLVRRSARLLLWHLS